MKKRERFQAGNNRFAEVKISGTIRVEIKRRAGLYLASAAAFLWR
ncbi:hypothetical protein [Gibbsiella quercinecans]|nr:hypothetical protein [Gibbsiella quercinecans]